MPEQLSEAQKRTHASVKFEHPSRHPGEFCGICGHYIPGSPPACTGVQKPIHPADWCHRWRSKPLVKIRPAAKRP